MTLTLPIFSTYILTIILNVYLTIKTYQICKKRASCQEVTVDGDNDQLKSIKEEAS